MRRAQRVSQSNFCGLRVAVVSAITNLAAGMRKDQHLSHDHTQRVAKLCADNLARLVVSALPDLVRA